MRASATPRAAVRPPTPGPGATRAWPSASTPWWTRTRRSGDGGGAPGAAPSRMRSSAMQVNSGIEAVGTVPWGSHFCQFYETADDLADTLVPFFKAGLDNGERCMWVTARPLRAADAVDALRSAVPDLD